MITVIKDNAIYDIDESRLGEYLHDGFVVLTAEPSLSEDESSETEDDKPKKSKKG